MKKIAILGRPNVGKSSLFNRLTGSKEAITSSEAGTTRDLKKRIVQIEGKEAMIIDTGGLEDRDELFEKVKKKALDAADQADIILYVVDGKTLPLEEDRRLFYDLQRKGKELALVVNKLDNDKIEENLWEFYSFGAKDIFGISVTHNRRVGRLLEWISKRLPDSQTYALEPEEPDLESFLEEIESDNNDNEEIKVAIIGRVNVGKSSLLNALTKEERSIVSEVAGTTIDVVDETVIYRDRPVTFIDTAGIRRRGKIEGIEKFALNRTQKMLQKADIALLVLDAKEGFAEQDEKIASLVEKYSLGAVIVLNKWDESSMDYKEAVQEVRHRFKFLSYAPIITVSAKTGKRVDRIFELILKVYANYSKRLSTSELNSVIKEAIRRHAIPSYYGKAVNILYAVQYDTKPPRIALIMNRPEDLHFSYKRYLVNKIRDRFDLEGTPVILSPKRRGEREEESDDGLKDS